MSEVPVTLLCLAQSTCVTGTLDMSQAPLRHKWKPGFSGWAICLDFSTVELRFLQSR